MSSLPQSSVKYIIKATIESKGVVEKPDIIGAIFGQTEGLLGPDMDLRQLQVQGKVGRIDVEVHDYDGESEAHIEIPSSLDSAETAILAASLETIDRVGPCISDVTVDKVEDVRVSKRNYIVDRAKEILDNMVKDAPSPEDLSRAVRKKMNPRIQTYYGLYAGPKAKKSSEVILCEGRSDVLNLLNSGYENAVAIGGTSVPDEVSEVCDDHKQVTVFLDGDRGGDLIEKEIGQKADIDLVARAPDGKEVEDLTGKEIEDALSDSRSFEHVSEEEESEEEFDDEEVSEETVGRDVGTEESGRSTESEDADDESEESVKDVSELSSTEKRVFSELLNGLVGTRAACLLDGDMKEVGRVPVSKLTDSIDSYSEDIKAVVFDGTISDEICAKAEEEGVDYLVGMKGDAKSSELACIRRYDI